MIIQQNSYENATWIQKEDNQYYYIDNNTQNVLYCVDTVKTYGDYAYVMPMSVNPYNGDDEATVTVGIEQAPNVLIDYKGDNKILQDVSYSDIICYPDNFIIYPIYDNQYQGLLYYNEITGNLDVVFQAERIEKMEYKTDDTNYFMIRKEGIYHLLSITKYQNEDYQDDIEAVLDPIGTEPFILNKDGVFIANNIGELVRIK